MTKAEFVELVQKNGEFDSKSAADRAVKAFIDSVTEALTQKETVSLVGFGTFSTVDVAEKSGKVPGTDKTYTKPAHTAPKFKMGKTLKDAVAAAN
ncbi:MAG: DNA-binding protein HU [uncultured Sulfurovum sp.]|uniref:DNA-binding protein HU n=1 Tax=uncultured Sulfurovum sp. TaxID=269237 RepID=A0A6S6TR57_9BACT|nr:MAG: DNA-binding protein HU [uncultured Sulfurovum sp.]